MFCWCDFGLLVYLTVGLCFAFFYLFDVFVVDFDLVVTFTMDLTSSLRLNVWLTGFVAYFDSCWVELVG